MPRAICRCGQELPLPAPGSERVVCPRCGARVRIRRPERPPGDGDGFIRFDCPCGRRLKVPADNPPPFGRCPDCDRVVPVPAESKARRLPPGHPETPTEELSTTERAARDAWARRHLAAGEPTTPIPTGSTTAEHSAMGVPGRVEAGLRVCPRCGTPVHLGATACRSCGTVVPKR